MLPFDDKQREILKDIFDRTYEDIVNANVQKTVTDRDAVMNAVLEFVERMIPKILNSYQGEEYETKRKGFAASLRVVISAIMPFYKFMEYMNLDEMKALDLIVKDLKEKGYVEGPDSFEALFKNDTGAPKGLYG